MGDYRRLDVWQQARALAILAYRLSETFPSSERFGLTSQVRRCAVSIMANIAEGCGRNRDSELGRYLSIALGSATELECHLTLAGDLEFLKPTETAELLEKVAQIRGMLSGLSRKLKKPIAGSR